MVAESAILYLQHPDHFCENSRDYLLCHNAADFQLVGLITQGRASEACLQLFSSVGANYGHMEEATGNDRNSWRLFHVDY
jgi:hypothetical protein